MDNHLLYKLISSVIIIFFGIMAKYSSQNDGWERLRKYWWVFIVIGSLSIFISVVKLFV